MTCRAKRCPDLDSLTDEGEHVKLVHGGKRLALLAR
jgi:hypothetical protein